MRIQDLRKEYSLLGLHHADLHRDPLEQFRKWLQEAVDANLPEPNAMTLATADREGRPSARTVLLKTFDARGFVFFTNYQSRKGREIAANSKVALVFYWESLERQVCIGGEASFLGREESEAYFNQRPRGSRLAAWASPQSEVLADRGTLERRMDELLAQYPDHEMIPMPPFWGGYLVTPDRVEFWQGRPNRLHDRFCYTISAPNEWTIKRLSP